MASSLDIYIDVTNGSLVAAGSARNGTLPILTRNDSYNLRLRLQERDQSGFLRDLDLTSSSIKLGIGEIDGDPTDGQFKMVLNSVTSTAISFNATTTQFYNAISAIAGSGVGVTTYGSELFAYLITSATSNTAMSFGGSAFTLFPTSSVLVSTRRFPAPSIAAQQVVRLVRNPAVFSDTFVASPTAGVIALTKVQDGSATKNETYDLAVGSDAEGGSLVLNFGTNSTTAIAIGASAASFAEALTSITQIGSENVSVDLGNNSGNYSISFVRGLGLTNITTALTLDASGAIFGSFLQTTCTLATAELDELFSETGSDTITPKIEIELTQNSTPKTVLQSDITIRRDLIATGSAVPANQASYLTSAEIAAAFVSSQNNVGFYGTTAITKPASTNVISALVSLGLIANTVTVGVTDAPTNVVTDWTGNVSATTRFLADSSAVTSIHWGNRVLKTSSAVTSLDWGNQVLKTSSAVTSVDWENRVLKTSSAITSVDWENRVLKTSTGATAVNWQTGAFGAGSTVVTIASNNVAISGSYYIAMGTANGAFRTLSTTTSVTFGTVAANDQHYRDVVVTGAAVNDIVLIGLPSAVSAGAVIQGVAYKANTVCLSCTNSDTGSLAINTATYRVTLLNYQ